MLSRSVYRWLLVLMLLLTGCADLGEDGMKALANKIHELQPLRVMDSRFINQINGLNNNVEEFNKVLAEAQRGGIPINFTADAGPELKKAADDFNRAVAEMNNLKVGLDEETLTQLAGLASILNAGLKVGLDKESLYELRHLTDTIAKTPENFEKSIEDVAPKVSKAVGDTLISVLDEARTDLEHLTAVIGQEGRCNADFLQSKANAFIGRSIMSRVMARFSNSPDSASAIIVSGVCQVLPAEIDLVWVNDQLNAADNSRNVQLYGYGLTEATVQIFDDSGQPVAGLPQITPYETTRYLMQINIQGIDFSQVGYRYRFVVQRPGDKNEIPIFVPAESTWTPTPALTATPLPQPIATCLKDNTQVHSYPVMDRAFAHCNAGIQLRAISRILEGTWIQVDADGRFGYVYVDDIQLNVPLEMLPVEVPPDTPVPQPPVAIPPPSCLFDGGPATINAGESARLAWTVTNAKEVYLSHDGQVEGVAENGKKKVKPDQTTTYKLILKDKDGQITECNSVTISVVPPVNPPVVEPPIPPVNPPSQDAYLLLYENPAFGGDSIEIRLAGCGLTNLGHDHHLNDKTSSFELFAPDNVEVILGEHQSFNSDFPGRTGRWRGNNDRLQVDIDQLSANHINDRISSVQWLIDGQPQPFICEQ